MCPLWGRREDPFVSTYCVLGTFRPMKNPLLFSCIVGAETLLYEADRWKETLENWLCRNIAILGFLMAFIAQGQVLAGNLLNLFTLEYFHTHSWGLPTLEQRCCPGFFSQMIFLNSHHGLGALILLITVPFDLEVRGSHGSEFFLLSPPAHEKIKREYRVAEQRPQCLWFVSQACFIVLTPVNAIWKSLCHF